MSEKVTSQRDEVTMAGVDLDAIERANLRNWGFRVLTAQEWKALEVELRAARAVVAAARAYVTGPGREDFDPAQIAAQLDRAIAEYDRLTGERQ